MKYDLLLTRMFDEKNPLTEEEKEWVHKQAATSRLVEALYIEHMNKVNKRIDPNGPEITQFHVSLGNEAQEYSVFELLQNFLNIDYSKAERMSFGDMKWMD